MNMDISKGYKKAPIWLKKAYRKAVKYRCQECGKHEEEVGILTIHRLIRGSFGGLYVPNNCKIVCTKCHKSYHQKEF